MADNTEPRSIADSSADIPIRILHLSDFHLSRERQWDQTPVLRGLVDAVGEMTKAGLAADVVAITGDLAARGSVEDYEQVQRWIDEGLRKALPPRFRRDRILIVPGNHDVDRDAVDFVARSCQQTLLEAQSQDDVAEILAAPHQSAVLLRRHEPYLTFAARYAAKTADPNLPWWSRRLELRGTPIHFVGLCSSWMSCSDEDQGRLLIGRWQACQLLDDVRDAAFRVVLVHHAWDYVAEFDSTDVEPLVHRAADLVLRGHLHRERTRLIQDPDHVHLELAAGSAYDGSGHANGFQLIELFPSARRVHVHYRVWHRGQWIPDANAYQGATDGVATIALTPGTPAPISAQPASAPPPERYLKFLRDLTSSIDIRGLQVASGQATSFPIDELYIPLTTTLAESQDEAEGIFGRRDSIPLPEARRGERVELHEALRNSRLAILGDPGSGKTTFLLRIASLLCRTLLREQRDAARGQLGLDPPPLPLFIRLAQLADHLSTARRRDIGHLHANAPNWLAHYMATVCEGASLGLDEAFFRAQLDAGGAIILLDGLDEAPSQRIRKQLSELIVQAAAAYPQCQFVVTSRPGAYQGDVILSGFTKVQIDPLEDEAIRHFLSRWCQLLFARKPSLCAEHLGELLHALESRADIRRLARNPVMLTALAVVHWNEKRLPEQRADLYESIIGWLSRAREQRPGRPPAERCVGLLQNLALAMHDHGKGRQTQLRRYEAAQLIASSFRDVASGDRPAAAERFLAEEEVDSGIVVGRGNTVRFWHLTFQEFLAARALAGCSDQDQRSRLFSQPKLYNPEWREVVLLLGGVLCSQAFERVDRMIAAILDQLGDNATLADQARCVGVLGAVLRDLAPFRYRAGDDRYPHVLNAVMGIFDRDRSGEVPIAQAIQAADALGKAGDPRFTRDAREQNWITMAAGEFWMGAQKKNRSDTNYDAEADYINPEGPVHKVWLDEYQVAKYPVTVGEYGDFVTAGGYAAEPYWSAGGFGQFERPDEWEEQLVYPNRPVVNVSWYEAAAYAAWRGCRLPTEAQWERAARGTEGRRYPWGDDDPDERRMNFWHPSEELRVGHTTPVGVYPRGDTPDGICDLAGNVWQWCSDRYGEYPNVDQRNPSGSDTGSSRVLRGGGWLNDARHCRSACRGDGHAGSRDDDFGFRLVRSCV